MDKKEAIRWLKQYLDEIRELRNSPDDNQRYEVCISGIANVIHAGLEPADYDTFTSARYQSNIIPVRRPGSYSLPHNQYYQENLTEKETAINKIIQKYEMLGIETEPASEKLVTGDKPKAFIAHEGETKALGKLKAFLDALGVKYLIAEIEPSDGRVVEEQVEWTKEQADFAIILATKGKLINKKTGKPQMGTNVADELGRARHVFQNRIILLLETGLEAHTNIGGIVRARFVPQSMDEAFIKIVGELRNWGFLRAGKAKE